MKRKYTAIVVVGDEVHEVPFESGAATESGLVRTAKLRASEWSFFHTVGGCFEPDEIDEVIINERS